MDFNDILRIIDTLSMKRNETVAVVYDEPVNINEYSLFFFSLTWLNRVNLRQLDGIIDISLLTIFIFVYSSFSFDTNCTLSKKQTENE